MNDSMLGDRLENARTVTHHRLVMLVVAALVVLAGIGTSSAEARLLVPMDLVQDEHLRAYGLAYWVLERVK